MEFKKPKERKKRKGKEKGNLYKTRGKAKKKKKKSLYKVGIIYIAPQKQRLKPLQKNARVERHLYGYGSLGWKEEGEGRCVGRIGWMDRGAICGDCFAWIGSHVWGDYGCM